MTIIKFKRKIGSIAENAAKFYQEETGSSEENPFGTGNASAHYIIPVNTFGQNITSKKRTKPTGTKSALDIRGGRVWPVMRCVSRRETRLMLCCIGTAAGSRRPI